MEPNDWITELGYLENPIESMKTEDHLKILVGLFSHHSTQSQLEKLNLFYKANTIIIKHEDIFQGDLFYQVLLNDILYWMPSKEGVFKVNKEEAGFLIELFCCCVSKMTKKMLDYPDIRFCFAMLPDFFREEMSTKAINCLTNFLNLIYVLKKKFISDNCMSIIRSNNVVFYELIRQQSILLFEKYKNEKEKKTTEENEKLIKDCQSYKHLLLSKNSDYLDKLSLLDESSESENEEILEKEEMSEIEEESLSPEEKEIKRKLELDAKIKKIKQIKINSFKDFKKLIEISSTNLHIVLTNYIMDEEEISNIGKEIKICFALIRNYTHFNDFQKSLEKAKGSESIMTYDKLMLQLFRDSQTPNYTQGISEILYDDQNIELFYNILKSPAVAKYYSSSNSEISEEIKFGYRSIPEYLKKDKEKIRKTIIDRILIIPLEETAKAITISYLRIAINPRWIKIVAKEVDSAYELLKAFVFITIFHESAHFLQRYKSTNKSINEVKTPRGKEGGEELIKYFFGKAIISDIDLNEAQELLILKNWDNVLTIQNIIKSKTNDKPTSKRDNYIQYMRKNETKEKWDCYLR